MTLPFALRTRIDFSEAPRRTRALRTPKVTGPIFAYWSVMGLLAYGVSSGALPLDEWFWPVEKEPIADEVDPSTLPENPAPSPPARVTPFPAQPVNPAPPVAPSPPIAQEESEPLEQPPVPPRDEAAAPPRVAEARRVTLSLNYTPPAHEEPLPVRTPAHERAPADKGRARETRPEPAPHLAWSMPAWGGSTGQSAREKLTSPDAARGRRHIDDGSDAFLFPGDPVNARGGGSQPRVPLAAVSPPFESDRAATPREAEPARAARNVGSCEAAAAAANDEMDLTKAERGAPDVTRDAYASILDNGRYLSGCRIPGGVRFEICAAVRDGRAVGVTVTTSPKNAGVAACVRAAVSRLSFPVSPRLDVTRTRFEPAR